MKAFIFLNEEKIKELKNKGYSPYVKKKKFGVNGSLDATGKPIRKQTKSPWLFKNIR